MDLGMLLNVAGVTVAGVAIGVGYLCYRRTRRLGELANALAEQSRRSAVNLAQSDERNLGFDHFVASVDWLQFGLCRDNNGEGRDKLTQAESDAIGEAIALWLDRGLELLRNSVTDYDVAQPALDYFTVLYLSSSDADDPVRTPPSAVEYEACRDWLHETRRVCNEMALAGAGQQHAEEVLREKAAAEQALIDGLPRRFHDPEVGVSIMFGESVFDLVQRNVMVMASYAELLPTCQRRVDNWSRLGLNAFSARG